MASNEVRPRDPGLRRKPCSQQMPVASEDEIGWRVIEEMSAQAAALLEPIFREHKGRNGRLSIQTDPRNYRNTQAILDQAVHFSQLAENMIVKIPVTRAGVAARHALPGSLTSQRSRSVTASARARSGRCMRRAGAALASRSSGCSANG